MHRVLLISEILTLIFSPLTPEYYRTQSYSLLHEDENGEYYERRPARAWVVALVCKAWKEPALDAFWETIPDPTVAFSLLVKVDKSSQNSSGLRWLSPKMPTLHAWTVFKGYSRRVKHLRLAHPNRHRVEMLLSYIGLRPLEDGHLPLFPSLLSIEAHCSEVYTRLLIQRFMSPSLRILDILSDLDAPMGVEPLLNAPDLCPNLVELVLCCSEEDGRSARRLISVAESLLLGFSKLQSITISPNLLVPSLLLSLSRIPTLTSLNWMGITPSRHSTWAMGEADLSLSQEIFNQDATQGELYATFPSLNNLQGYVRSLEEAVIIVSLLSCPQLRNMDLVIVVSSLQVNPSNILPFMELLAQHAGSLRSLHLDFRRLFSSVRMDLPLSSLQPLHACRNLKSLHLRLGSCVGWSGLSNTGLASLLQQLPNLEDLTFVQRSTTAPLLALDCLETLVSYCPGLESIELTLDARNSSKIDDNPSSHKLYRPSERLKRIRFASSPVDEADAFDIMTYLRTLTTQPLSVGPSEIESGSIVGPDLSFHWAEIWVIVRNLITMVGPRRL